jgi:peptide-methionine (S)-S-oxide reductase
VYDRPIVTEVTEASTFWEAEDYHKDYFNRNPQNPYCSAVIAPKLAKFLKIYTGQ